MQQHTYVRHIGKKLDPLIFIGLNFVAVGFPVRRVERACGVCPYEWVVRKGPVVAVSKAFYFSLLRELNQSTWVTVGNYSRLKIWNRWRRGCQSCWPSFDLTRGEAQHMVHNGADMRRSVEKKVAEF